MITIRQIQEAVCDEFQVSIHEMVSSRRSQRIACPRYVAIYLSRELTLHSLPTIAKYFGNRDHTSIMNSLKKIKARMSDDPELNAKVQRLNVALSPHLPDKQQSALTETLRALVNTSGITSVVLAIAEACETVVRSEQGKPAGVIASINANLLRLAVSRMIA